LFGPWLGWLPVARRVALALLFLLFALAITLTGF
jgi:hypothetical protein